MLTARLKSNDRQTAPGERQAAPVAQMANLSRAGRMGLARSLQRSVGNRAVGRLLQRQIREINEGGSVRYYSTVTGFSYGSLGEAMHEERAFQNFFGTFLPGAGLGYEPQDDPLADPTWDPQEIFLERMHAALTGQRQMTDLEQFVVQWPGSYERVESAPGIFSIRRGRGGQPFVQSRLADYANQRVAVDYDAICSVLDHRSAGRRERLAWHLLLAADGDRVSFDRYDDVTRRAAAHLLAITQLAEEHHSRTPGSAEYARAGLLAVADGVYTFTEVFARVGGRYAPAHHGGTQEMRDLASGQAQADPLLAGNMDNSQ